jgi:hypothetical protein
MPELPTCDCISGFPPYDRLTFIYQAAVELSGDTTLPSADCVAGVPLFQRFAYIYAAFRVIAEDDSLPSMECVEGEPFQDQVTRIYEAARIYSGDAGLPEVDCVRGTPIWQQWVNIYEALYSAAGEPDDLTDPACVGPQFDVLSQVFCGMVFLLVNAEPFVLSASILPGGDQLQIVFTQSVTGQDGFELDAPGAPSLTYVSGEGTDTYIYSVDPPVSPGDVVTMDYNVGATGNVVNLVGNPLATINDFPVLNNAGGFTYLRPGGVDTYFRPDGVSQYIRP